MSVRSGSLVCNARLFEAATRSNSAEERVADMCTGSTRTEEDSLAHTTSSEWGDHCSSEGGSVDDVLAPPTPPGPPLSPPVGGALASAVAEIARLRAENERLRALAVLEAAPARAAPPATPPGFFGLPAAARTPAGGAAAPVTLAALTPPPGLTAPEAACGAAAPATLSGVSTAASDDEAEHAEPPAALGTLSLGSALHASGTCSPCAWFWKPQGCAHGSECLRCHACPPGETLRRKRDKGARLRLERDMEILRRKRDMEEGAHPAA